MDALARQGAIFNQSYSGAATCAKLRAMLMAERYSAGRGFTFTPMLPGMGRVVGWISASMERSLPPPISQSNVARNKPSYELQGLSPEQLTIAEILVDALNTVHIGKCILAERTGWHRTNRVLRKAFSWPVRCICLRSIPSCQC